jgi:hypothetical protein
MTACHICVISLAARPLPEIFNTLESLEKGNQNIPEDLKSNFLEILF